MSVQKKAGVIGWPIEQSRSPLIHGFWLSTYQMNGAYEKFAVKPEELPEYISNLKNNGLEGINLTIPHKETVLPLVDEITPTAKAIGAANTLYFADGQLIADNTDSYGFLKHLGTSAPNWQVTQPAMIIGAGGAARAIIHALLSAGVPEILITNRTASRAETLAKDFGPKLKPIPWQEKEQHLNQTHLLVNSTSLGMQGKPELDLDISTLPAGAVVYDIVYVPLETKLLKAAKAQSLTPVDGLGMLLHQAVPGFELWFGVRPAVTEELYKLITDDLEHT